MDNDYLNEENDLVLSYDCPQFFAEEKIEEERNPLMELFPGTLAMSLNNLDHYSDPQLQLFGDLVIESVIESDLGPALPEIKIENVGPTLPEIKIEIDDQILVVPKQEPKKRGRPRKNEASPVEPSRKYVPSAELSTVERKKKKRKCMTQVEKAQHNHLERERRKGMTMLLERLRELVPAVSYDKKASQKKIVDEAALFLKEVKPDFLSYLKERQRFLRLETLRRDLERELASRPKKGVLFVWEERQGMSASDLYRKVKKEAREDIRDEEIDEAIRLLESSPQKSYASSPDHSDSSEDSEDEEHINVEV